MARIIPELLDNSFRIAVDPLFQPLWMQDEASGVAHRRRMELL